jgi:hypothetical protein
LLRLYSSGCRYDRDVNGTRDDRRPALFRALGHREPPESIDVAGHIYHREHVVKHDSWAATVTYLDAAGSRLGCKFGRCTPLAIIPGARLGRWLARRERRVFDVMRDVEGFPRDAGPVSVAGHERADAVAHPWIDGRPFSPWERVDDSFFPRLERMLARLHAHDIAYVDMSKWENILIGADGRSHLIDFQIYFRLPAGWPLRWFLRQLQEADRYYLRRHWRRARPDQIPADDLTAWERQPPVVRLGEALGQAWRLLRRAILALFGVRDDPRRTISQPPV